MSTLDENFDYCIQVLQQNSHPEQLTAIRRFGITAGNMLGVRIPVIRNLAATIRQDHLLALKLWTSGIHEARILASMVASPALTNKELMSEWTYSFDSWDVCDQCCGNLFRYTESRWELPYDWIKNEKEYIRRAAFVMMACLALKEKKTHDREFLAFFSLIKEYSGDSRNFVKKANNWALRQLGKRSLFLHEHALETAVFLADGDTATSRWIGKDALRELQNPAIIKRLSLKKS